MTTKYKVVCTFTQPYNNYVIHPGYGPTSDYNEAANNMQSIYRTYDGFPGTCHIETIDDTPAFEPNPIIPLPEEVQYRILAIKNLPKWALNNAQDSVVLRNNLQYFFQKLGWSIDEIKVFHPFIDDTDEELQIHYHSISTDPITIIIVVGIILAVIGIIAYGITAEIRDIYGVSYNKEFYQTQDDWIKAQQAVIDSPNTSQEAKDRAAQNLLNAPPPTTTTPPPPPDTGGSGGGLGSLFTGVTIGSVIVLAIIVYVFMRKK